VLRVINRRPSPAFVLAALSLLVGLSGTSYAATAGQARHSHAAVHATKPLTRNAVRKLIATYVKNHKAMLRGPAGATGPAGPGAVPFSVDTTSASTLDYVVASIGGIGTSSSAVKAPGRPLSSQVRERRSGRSR
jgi:hypothetical protein